MYHTKEPSNSLRPLPPQGSGVSDIELQPDIQEVLHSLAWLANWAETCTYSTKMTATEIAVACGKAQEARMLLNRCRVFKPKQDKV